jgi:outer membrane lipopolysaccharide assembly protein LptE/RlpB
MYRLMNVLTSCFMITLLASCAFDLVHVKQIPEQLESTQSPQYPFQLERDVNVSLGTGYGRVLKQGTMWHYVGRISSGDVYKTKDQVLTIEASNIYEAYIVVSSGRLVGFYLPVERTFSPVSDSKDLPMHVLKDE